MRETIVERYGNSRNQNHGLNSSIRGRRKGKDRQMSKGAKGGFTKIEPTYDRQLSFGRGPGVWKIPIALDPFTTIARRSTIRAAAAPAAPWEGTTGAAIGHAASRTVRWLWACLCYLCGGLPSVVAPGQAAS